MGAHMSIYAYGPTYAYKAEQLYTVRPIATYCVFASVENIDVARPIKNFGMAGGASSRDLNYVIYNIATVLVEQGILLLLLLL